MPNRLILKVTKFQLLPPKRLGTVVKNILGAIMPPPLMSNGVKEVSSSMTLEDFKELLDFNKIIHAEAERMTSKRTGTDLPFIKIKCDNPKQAEALISED